MELPDETIEYQYQGALTPAATEAFTPIAELQGKNFLSPARLRTIVPQVNQVRSQVAAERDLAQPPPELRPLDAGFIDLPQKLLDEHRRRKEQSELGRVIALTGR